MEQNFQTSFIPKKPMIEERSVPSRPTSLLTIISIFIFITVVVSSAGLYFYKGVLVKDIAGMNADLILAKSRFEPSKITQLQVLDKRLRASNSILSSHITVSPIFEALQALTMKSVRYTKFSYSIDDKNKINVKMSGQTVGYGAYSAYASIALQSDLFTKNKNLIDPVFSNLSLDDKGNVIFDLDFSVNPTFVNYKGNLSSEGNISSGNIEPGEGMIN
ncbi:MAG: hypothetical protein WCX46_01565 [Candidatus Paceibacterota bacterium]